MNLIFSQILFACSILAFFFCVTLIKKKELQYKENRMVALFCLSSAIWSFGFFGVFIQKVPENAYTWRGLGMIGTFGYLIFAQYLICHYSNISIWFKHYAKIFSYLGIVLYFFVIRKDQVTYTPSSFGMTYSFNPGIWNTLYILYSVIVAVNMFLAVLYMLIHAPNQRLKDLGKQLLATEGIIFFGMLFDTVFPMTGMPALPGSSIAQFFGLAVMYNAILVANQSRVNISNMSEFIYYSLTVPVLVYDSKHHLQILNDTAYSFLGLENNYDKNTEITKLFSIEQEDIFQFDDQSQEIDAICLHNQLYCSLSINKIHDKYKDVIGYIIIVTDLSERMKSMKRLEEAMKEAEYANQAKSTFLANMSHEIRTPMNAIVGFSELVLKMNIDPNVRSHVEDIKWSSHNLLSIINDILDISKIESGKIEIIPEPYSTGQLFSDLALIIAPHAEKKGLDYFTHIDEHIPRTLHGDLVRIRGVLINVLTNAIKYTPSGSVTFDVSILERDEKKITLSFQVKDTGVGIKEENLQSVFNKFERLDSKIHYGIEGSGLGLAICSKYVALMGGEIKVDSTYGKGSVFTVIIQQDIVDATPMEQEYSQSNSQNGSTGISNLKIKDTTVLITDDNLINLRVAQGILSYYGLHVDTATSGQEAIDLCKKKNYSIVFMDQMMPEMDGIEAMEHIRSINTYYQKDGEVKLIVLTANAIKGTKEILLSKGFDGYLGKPINIEQLEQLFLQFIPSENIYYEEPEETNKDSTNKANESSQDISPASLGTPETSWEFLYLKKQLPQLDVSLGIKHCGGTLSDYMDILQVTYEYGEKQLEELTDLWNTQDYENYVIKIHAMKSTSLNIGAVELSKLAKEQELEGKAGNYAYIQDHFDLFLDGYKRLLEDLKTVLEHFQQLPEPKAEHTENTLDEEKLKSVLHTIDERVDDFAFNEIYNTLAKLKEYELSEEYMEIITTIEHYMDDFSIDDLKDYLAKFL